MLGRFKRLGPWLFGLFLIAQIGGVVPLVYVDTVHEYEHTDSAALAAPDTQGMPQHQYHPGVHDEHDQCCAMHHGLIGTLPDGSHHVAPFIHGVVLAHAPEAPISTQPSRIDRPPRVSALI
jgi:hypothetical protein